MVIIKNSREIACMRASGVIAGGALKLAGELIEPGVTTQQVDREIRKFIVSAGAQPSFLGYGGFPANACISVNEQLIHGIPSARKMEAGDVVSIDVGACLDGFHSDCAATFIAGEARGQSQHLLDVTRECLYKAIGVARAGARLGDVGEAVSSHAKQNGYSVVVQYVGHGVGKNLHEDPEVPNYGVKGHGLRLEPGMTIAIEPMICMGGPEVKVLDDGWTVVTVDGSLCAHFEHTVAICDGDAQILTL